ncbi:hypothetical protein V7S43_003648 [Phytophthora oleae]|uniref:Uncharacterized protein n=1 Tax=Phytophthora oleae TaxID=2107226 RepID=A0ABD3FYB5_9STRA
MPAPTTEGNGLTQVTPARLAIHKEIYHEPIPAEPRQLDFIGLALKPIPRGSRNIERTDVRSFMSRRSITECSDHTTRRHSISDEPIQWATSAMPTTAVSISPSVSKKTPLRKNLRYAGKRVMMAIRVKSALSGTDKLELMRLMLQKHTICAGENQ